MEYETVTDIPTEQPVAQYELKDEYGTHHVSVPNGTMKANELLTKVSSPDGPTTSYPLEWFQHVFQYMHGNIDELDRETLEKVLRLSGLVAIYHDRIWKCHIIAANDDGFDVADNEALSGDGRVVIAHENDLPGETA